MESIAECLDCPPGHYCAERALTAPTGTCRAGHICFLLATLADPVYNNDTTGDLTVITFGDICDPGKYCPEGTSTMVDCPRGTYNPSFGVGDVAGCTPCDPGHFCNTSGLVEMSGTKK